MGLVSFVVEWGWGAEAGFAEALPTCLGFLAWPQPGRYLPCQGLTPIKASVGPKVA